MKFTSENVKQVVGWGRDDKELVVVQFSNSENIWVHDNAGWYSAMDCGFDDVVNRLHTEEDLNFESIDDCTRLFDVIRDGDKFAVKDRDWNELLCWDMDFRGMIKVEVSTEDGELIHGFTPVSAEWFLTHEPIGRIFCVSAGDFMSYTEMKRLDLQPEDKVQLYESM